MSGFSVRKPYTVLVGVLIIFILGVVSFMNLTTDLLPNMELPYVAIMTTYPGATPEQVEEKVSKVIEQGMMGISNIKDVRSTSSENYSLVFLEFNGDSNMDSIMIEISQKMDVLKSDFEDGISTPIVMRINPDMMPVLISAVDMKNMEIGKITEFTKKTLIPELESVDGVASVELYGAIEDEIKIKLNQQKIDSINDKMLDAVNHKLAKNKKDLDSAQSKINSGKAELEKTKKEKTQEIADGIAGVESGRNEITKAEVELESKSQELSTKKTELESNLSPMNTAESELTAQKQKLENGLNAVNSKISELEQQKQGLSDRQKELESKRDSGEITGEELIELNKVTNSVLTLDGTISNLKSSDEFVQMTAGLEKLNTSYEELIAGKEKLSAGLAQLNSGITQMEGAKAQIESKKQELNTLSSNLQIAQSTLVSETTKAETKLDIAKQELDKGLEEFEKARDKALKDASIDGIITNDMISQILTAENFSMPAGYVNDDITVKVGEKFETIDEIKNLVLFHFGLDGLEQVTLEEVADIEVTDNSNEIYSKVNGNNGIVLSFSKQSTASTKNVSEAIQKKLEELQEKYGDIEFTTLMDQGIYIDLIIGSVMNSLVVGGALAIIILFLFLKEIKPTVIVAISIPVSLIFAIAMMYFTGVSINIMSLSGLALGVGMLVDNSIVVIENIFRLKQEGKDVKDAAIEGAKNVAGAIIASTLTTVCVFLPIVFVHGMSRQLFQDIGLTIAYSLFASLIIALTVVPAMASKMFKKVGNKENKIIAKLSNVYLKMLSLALRFKIVVILVVVILLGTSIYLTTQMEIEFIPDVASSEMSISITMPDEASDEDEKEVADTVIERLLTIDEIKKIGAIDMGSSESILSMGSSGISMYIILDENRQITNNQIANKIKELTSDLNAEIKVSTSDMDMSSMMSTGVSVKIIGKEIDTLKQISDDVENKLSEIDGIDEIKGAQENSATEKRICIDKNKAMKYNLTVAQVYSTISSKLKSEIEGTIIELDNKEYQLILQKSSQDEVNVDNLMNIDFKVSEDDEDKTIHLSEIATIEDGTGLNSITREDNERYVTVSATIKDGYGTTMVSRNVQNVFDEFQAPEGYKIEVSGELEDTMKYMKDLGLMIFVAIMFIYLIMVAQFQSLKLPFIVMFTMPLAFTGGLLALFITGKSISIIAMLGFLVLAGIVVNNGIVFIDCINQLVESGIEKKEAILQTGKMRLRPILMTALTTILGLVSMALGIGDGAEMTQPLGIVAIGGLVYSTILTLFLVPVLYDLFYRRKSVKL